MTFCVRYAFSNSSTHRPILSPSPVPSTEGEESYRNSSSDPHPRPRCTQPSAADHPSEGVLTPPVRLETVALLAKSRSKIGSNTCRNAACTTGLAPSGSPKAVSPHCPAWVSTPASPLEAGSCRPQRFQSLARLSSKWRSNLSTVWWSTPAAPPLAFTSAKAARRFVRAYTLSIKLNHLPPLTPSSRAVNIRSVQTEGSAQAQRAASLRCLVSLDTTAGSSSLSLSVTSPPSCAPSAPSPLREFFATMGALAPVGPALWHPQRAA